MLKCAYWFELKSRYSNNDLWSDSSFHIWLEILRYVFQAISQVFMRYILLWYNIVVISIPVIVVCPLHIYSQIQNLNGHGSFLCLTFIPMNFPVYHFLLFIVFCFNSKLDVYSYSTLQVCPPQTTLYCWQIC